MYPQALSSFWKWDFFVFPKVLIEIVYDHVDSFFSAIQLSKINGLGIAKKYTHNYSFNYSEKLSLSCISILETTYFKK